MNFTTEYSKDISKELLEYGITNIDRYNKVIILMLLLNDVDKVKKLENGIFEFSLIYVSINNYPNNFVVSVYNDKFNEIYLNLDPKSRNYNKTLIENIKNETLKIELVPFLSPQQINPKKWISLLEKEKTKEDVEKNMATTDLYTCRKCGGKKFRIRELQTRSADEPSTKFVTCLTCHNVFTTI